MRAVGYKRSLPIDQAESLIDVEIDKPAPQGRDLLVQVKAISVNPVDTKVRMRAAPKDGEPAKILGYDATGVVAAVGPDVTLFKAGDEVWYAGSIIRPGTNSGFHLVDERIVGAQAEVARFRRRRRPSADVDHRVGNPVRPLRHRAQGGGEGQIAADHRRRGRRRLDRNPACAHADQTDGDRHRVTPGDAGVVQGAWRASRDRPFEADGRADQGRRAPLRRLHLRRDASPAEHFDTIADVIAPQGKFGLIDDPKSLDIAKFKGKSASLHWEAMFTRSTFQTPDMDRAAQAAQRGRRDGRHGNDPHHGRGEPRHDQRREPAPRPRHGRKRPHARQGRAGRLLISALRSPSCFPRCAVCTHSDR